MAQEFTQGTTMNRWLYMHDSDGSLRFRAVTRNQPGVPRSPGEPSSGGAAADSGEAREGMMLGITTAGTCAEGCWYAREPTCKCSCGGAAHGMLLVHGAEQPRRNCKIKGHRYVLAAVLDRHGFGAMVRVEVAAEAAGIDRGSRGSPRAVAFHKLATPAQVARWPELAAYHDPQSGAARGLKRPTLLWVRADAEGVGDSVAALSEDEWRAMYAEFNKRLREERRQRIGANSAS